MSVACGADALDRVELRLDRRTHRVVGRALETGAQAGAVEAADGVVELVAVLRDLPALVDATVDLAADLGHAAAQRAGTHGRDDLGEAALRRLGRGDVATPRFTDAERIDPAGRRDPGRCPAWTAADEVRSRRPLRTRRCR